MSQSRAGLLPLLQEHLKAHFEFGHFHKRPTMTKKLAAFLKEAGFIDGDVGDTYITEFAQRALDSDGTQSERFLPVFLEYGIKHDISYYYVGPEYSSCPKCMSDEKGTKELHTRFRSHAMLYTLRYGPIPVVTEKAHCIVCKTIYHPTYNYHEEDAQQTRIYETNHSFIEVSPSVLFDKDLCKDQANYTAHAWVSFSNHAKVYNCRPETKHRAYMMIGIPKYPSVLMDEIHVNHAFFMNALLVHHAEKGQKMKATGTTIVDILSQNCAVRNDEWKDRGSPYLLHACDMCTWHINEDEFVHACVTDGVCIGRMCCAVSACTEDLVAKTRFCIQHSEYVHVCEVKGCQEQKTKGHRTCKNDEHMKLEERYLQRNKAMEGLAKHGEGQLPEQSKTTQDNDTGLRLITKRAVTHNEQLVVATCGIIKARTTFRESESLTATAQWWQRLFPNEECMPTVMFYDNNCQMRRYLKKREPDSYLLKKALVVDVFHHANKHKKNFEECQRDCNPSLYQDLLIEENGTSKWRFNSSVCEQQNSWIVQFQSNLREMKGWKYDFFLDEVIKIRNDGRTDELTRKGLVPYFMQDKSL